MLPLQAPIVTIVEAKKNDIEAGLGQCIAQMVAANQFNHMSGKSAAVVFGCVTTGEAWQFLRLADKEALLEQRQYYIDNVGMILAAMGSIVNESCPVA